jgi:hypothetical protein
MPIHGENSIQDEVLDVLDVLVWLLCKAVLSYLQQQDFDEQDMKEDILGCSIGSLRRATHLVEEKLDIRISQQRLLGHSNATWLRPSRPAGTGRE